MVERNLSLLDEALRVVGAVISSKHKLAHRAYFTHNTPENDHAGLTVGAVFGTTLAIGHSAIVAIAISLHGPQVLTQPRA